MDLRTSAELAVLLRLKTPGAAEKKARELGVSPYAFGRGRGKGNRWDWIEVQEALRATREKRQKAPMASSAAGIIGRPVAEIMAELTGASPRQ